MIVRCISNRGADLPDACLDPRAGISKDTVFPISAGREYLVFGTAVAALVFALPPEARLPAVAGGATLAFGLYAVRERGPLRHLSSALGGLLKRQQSQDEALASILGALNGQAHAAESHSTRLDRVHDVVHEVGEELSAIHAAATTEVLTQFRQQKIELLERLTQLAELAQDADRRLDRAEQRLGHAATQTELRRLHSESLIAAGMDFRQTEALLALHSLFRVRAPLPPSRKWAASPDVLQYLISLVLDQSPHLVVELGGGLSTVWLSYAIEKLGGRVVSLEHDARFASTTRALLSAHGLATIAEIRDAPLTDVELDGETWPWYEPAALADIERCDLLVVDGPKAVARERARYPALPLLVERLAEHATIILDDCIRQDEKDIVTEWRKRYPDWHVEMLDNEKGTAVFTR